MDKSNNNKIEKEKTSLPEDAEDRNQYPMAEGLLYYFPNALAEISKISKFGNDQHNPGEPLHWARGKSTDHANKIVRHLIDAGKTDKYGNRHSAFVAWRALALLQEELERDLDLPLPRNAWPAEEAEPEDVRFNEGDLVRIVANTSSHSFPIGSIARIVVDRGDYYAAKSYFGTWAVHDEDIEATGH
jgi:hypothetical protein